MCGIDPRRFWSKVEKTDGCWLWTGASNDSGYGRIRINGKLDYSHRVSFFMHGGQLKDGEDVLHECNNPPCVRPSHLFGGTPSRNTLDAIRDGLFVPGHIYGSKHPWAKLSEEDVVIIRSLGGTMPQVRIAERFSITQAAVSKILLFQNRTRG